jgi:hypothetical protein
LIASVSGAALFGCASFLQLFLAVSAVFEIKKRRLKTY